MKCLKSKILQNVVFILVSLGGKVYCQGKVKRSFEWLLFLVGADPIRINPCVQIDNPGDLV